MLKKLFLFGCLALFSVASFAQDAPKKSTAKKVVLKGYLSDVRCGEGLENVKTAALHTKECCLMDDCAASGYGVYANKKFIKFDAAGSEKAKAFLTSTKKEKDLKVVVKGELKDGILAVASIDETK